MSDLYGGFAEFYDHVVPDAARQDIRFFVELALESGGPVLEVGCGTGRILLPTARAGIPVTGLDSSAAMLARLRQKLDAEPPQARARVDLAQADMRDFDLGREYPLVTLPFRPFQHLATVEEQISCLAALRRHLRPGGRLVLDLFNPSLSLLADPRLSEFGQEPEFKMPDGRRVARSFRAVSRDHFRQLQELEVIHRVRHPDGREEVLSERVTLRHLFRYEVEHLLERCGFRLETVYADYDRSPYGSKDPGELICVARKSLS